MKKIFILFFVAVQALGVVAQTTTNNKNKRYFDINKSIDVFNSVIKELDFFYVDSLRVDSLVDSTIRNMLAGLDPYTEYYSEDNIGDLKFLTTGEYGGIGSVISYNNNRVIINEPYKGLAADKAGLKAGDIILEIDGQDMQQSSVKEASDKLKGTPGTEIRLKIQRPGENKPREFKIKREKIEIDPITYATLMDNNTGYLHFSSFTEGSSKKVRETFTNLKKEGAQSLILDLRGNGGGILDEAVNIVNFFVPKNVEIVSTKGKVKQWDRNYHTLYQPIDTLFPIVVLIDTGSASASEIVAGSLQDLDRAVIVGKRSFGKGLVQTTRDLPYGGNIKLTTSKYYIPSGRSIQVLDYSHRKADGSASRVPDSLTHVFYTQKGRVVRDGGGITPDIEIAQEKSGNIAFYLMAQNIVFDYVTNWVQQHKEISSPETFHLPDADYDKFKEFVKSKDFKYDQLSARSMESLKNIMEFEGYYKTAEKEFKALEAQLKPNLDRDLELFRNDIKSIIESEIVQRYYYKEGVLRMQLRDDPILKKAMEVLGNKEMYNSILAPAQPTLADSKQ